MKSLAFMMSFGAFFTFIWFCLKWTRYFGETELFILAVVFTFMWNYLNECHMSHVQEENKKKPKLRYVRR